MLAARASKALKRGWSQKRAAFGHPECVGRARRRTPLPASSLAAKGSADQGTRIRAWLGALTFGRLTRLLMGAGLNGVLRFPHDRG